MQKFREERRAEMRGSWRGLVFFTCLLIVCAYLVIRGDGFLQTFMAFVLGAGLTTPLVRVDAGLQRRHLRWRWGAAGERWTADELARLNSSEWRVHHDIPDGQRQLGSRRGRPTWRVHDRLEESQRTRSRRRQGASRWPSSLRRKHDASSAVRMKELIERHGGPTVWVQGVFAVWGQLRPSPWSNGTRCSMSKRRDLSRRSRICPRA